MARQRDINARDKEAQALGLRKDGLTYEAIAARLGYAHHESARRAVRRAMDRTIQEPADELRALELERLDALLEAIWPQALAGRLPAVDRVLRIMERRAQLLGLDAPRRQAVNVITHDAIDLELRKLAAEIAELEDAEAASENGAAED